MTIPSKPQKKSEVVVRALRTRQAGRELFSFFLPGGQVLRVADIERLSRNRRGRLKGFQRPEIRKHVRSIVEYLNHRAVIFPNAIILAVSPSVKFTGSRGPSKTDSLSGADAGYLTLPLRSEGERIAWIVDGQQRSIALSQANNPDLPVPVVAFACDDLAVQREQFILVNKARPLSHRLIDELLPETSVLVLPEELGSRRIPSALCNALTRDKESPFFGLIRRPSMGHDPKCIVLDSAVVSMIKDRIDHPLGALATFRALGEGKTNVQRMYQVLLDYWRGVKEVFPEAWGKPPAKSRLMHSAGISAMGVLMDQIASRLGSGGNFETKVRGELRRIAPKCAWTEGTWPFMGMRWDSIESTPRDIRALSQILVRLYAEARR